MANSENYKELVVTGDMESVESCTLNVGESVHYAIASPDKTTGNEDSMGILQIEHNVAALVVADGLGGYRAGDKASFTAIKTLFKSLRKYDTDEQLRMMVLNGLENANEKVLEVGGGAATTLVGAMMSDKIVRIYHVGDSGALLIGQRGVEKFRTIAHSPVGLAEASGLINEEDALAHESRHLVSNVLGSSSMRIEIGPPIRMARYDTLLLASDGLFDNLRTAEIIELIRKGPLKSVAEKMRKAIEKRMSNFGKSHPSKPDDLSFILFRRNK